MTRRLTVAFVAMVLATLLLVGFGTLAVASVRSRVTTVKELRTQAVDLAANVGESLTEGLDESAAGGPAAVNRLLKRRLALVRRFAAVFKVGDLSVVVLDGQTVRGDLPAGVTAADLDVVALRSGVPQSGRHAGFVWAAAATASTAKGRAVAVILSRDPSPGLGAAWRWFVLAGLITLGLSVVAATMLSRRLVRPIREASGAAHQIAAGDFATRLVPPSGRTDELSELTDSINTMATSLGRSQALEQEFLLSVSHDLRTPLTSIRGFAEAIADGAGDPKRAAAVISTEAARLDRLVRDLLDLAKLRAAGFTFQLRPVDLGAATKQAVAGFALDDRNDVVEVRTGRLDPVFVAADPDRLGQVLANLIENATKYARRTVEANVWSDGGRAIVTVEDDGPGIDEADLPHVFDRLYVSRLEPQRRENSSGLGLAIVRELVQAMGGSVGVDRSGLGGARFHAAFPVSRRDPAGAQLPPPLATGH